MKRQIQIDENIVLTLQRLCVEVDSKKELLSFMIDKGVSFDNPRFQEYQEGYQEDFLSYEEAKKWFQKNCIEPSIEGAVLKSWDLDFDTCTCSVDIEDE